MEEVQQDGENSKIQQQDKKQNEEKKEEIQINRRKSHKWCSVPLCKTRFPRDKVSFHKFPKDPTYRKKWAIALRIGKKVTNNMCVCGSHFVASDYIPTWKPNAKRILKLIAIPSQNLPVRRLDKKLSPDQIKRKDDRAERAAKRLEREDPRTVPVPVKKEKTEIKDSGNSADSKPLVSTVHNKSASSAFGESIKQQNCNAEKTETNLTSCVKANYSDNVCNCSVRKEIFIGRDESYETKAAKILVELNEKVHELINKDSITYQFKDIILKKGEDFYFAARRYYKASISTFLRNRNDLFAFTGVDFNLLDILCKTMTICEGNSVTEYKIELKERIVLCLIKIRLNLSFTSVANLFHVNEDDAKTIFYDTVPSLKAVLRSAIYWPTKDDILKSMPESCDNFKKTITVFDCTEIFLQTVICSECRLPIPLPYNRETLKILLGFAQCGLITYISKSQPGRASGEIIKDENYISKVLTPSSDAIMTGGFFIEEEYNNVFIKLLKSRKGNLFCPENILNNKKTHDHVVNAFQRCKMFKILQSPIPSTMASFVDDISVIICGLVNLSNSVIADKKF